MPLGPALGYAGATLVHVVSTHNFGVLISYLLSGLIALWGASYFSEPIRVWFGTAPANDPTVGGFLYVTLAAVMAGLIVSTVRWMIVDGIHHLTGIPRPNWDFSCFEKKFAAYDMLGEVHYRFYQFYGLCGVPHKLC